MSSHTVTSAIVALALLSPASGGESRKMLPSAGVSAIRARIHSDSTSAVNPDLAWNLIDVLMKAHANSGSTKFAGRGSNGARYWQWTELSNRLLHDLGLSFYDAYPTDPRRWQWLYAVLQCGDPYYFHGVDQMQFYTAGGIPIDTAAQLEWKKRKPQLIAEFLASPVVKDDQKSEVAFAEFFEREYKAQVATWGPTGVNGALYDLPKWSHEFLALCAKYPNAPAIEVQSLANFILEYARKNSVAGPTVIAALRTSPNATVRTVVNAELWLADARKTPIHIHFRALDGRDVDFSKLRGKAVVIDFSAYTWCGACRELDPELHALYERFHPYGLEVIGFALENDPRDKTFVAQFAKEHGITWPLYFEGRGMYANEYVQQFGIAGVPHLFLFDKQGLLVSTSLNEILENNGQLVGHSLGLAPEISPPVGVTPP